MELSYNRSLFSAGFLCSTFFAVLVCLCSGCSEKKTITQSEIWSRAQELKLTAPLKRTEAQLERAKWGAKLFRDVRFSSNQKISCASCHDPENHFTDGKPVSMGIGHTSKNSPSLLNSAHFHWFFWNGRAPSLESQIKGPIENTAEHGISRLKVAKLVSRFYRAEYEKSFGRLPREISQLKEGDASPEQPKLEDLKSTLGYGLATLSDSQLFLKWNEEAQTSGITINEWVAAEVEKKNSVPDFWLRNQKLLKANERAAVEKVFLNFAVALADYERGLTTLPSEFDSFLGRWKKNDKPISAFNSAFGESEFRGLSLFVGRANCILCHSGPFLTDQQFHNIGLSHRGDDVDFGRTVGVQLAKKENCEKSDSESCREMLFLNSKTLEIMGAFKTPSLRQVSETAPYFHDGRANTLEEVLEHYSELASRAAVGHREESLKPLFLSTTEKGELVAFLKSLRSDVRDDTIHQERSEKQKSK